VIRKKLTTLLALLALATAAQAQTADELFATVRTKVLQVKDYVADVNMKIDVAFMQVPMLKGKLYYKAPDKMKLERNGGISILPRKNINMTLSNLIPTGKVTVIDMGITTLKDKKLRLLKVVPDEDNNGIVLTKMWLDEKELLVTHTETTTFNDGTVIMDLDYKNYNKYGLPDKVKIFMDLKEYKLPKGVTMDYNDVLEKTDKDKTAKKQKGTIEIRYLNYTINKGIPDAIFAAAKKTAE
jgi:outer membrane lipoprotein-sorting protein